MQIDKEKVEKMVEDLGRAWMWGCAVCSAVAWVAGFLMGRMVGQ
jgi:predicted branched-subunit amino acid permease